MLEYGYYCLPAFCGRKPNTAVMITAYLRKYSIVYTFQFQVEENKKLYLVKWLHTWESVDQLVGCEDLIEIFRDSPKNYMDHGCTVSKVCASINGDGRNSSEF